jgi:hypothetical protein
MPGIGNFISVEGRFKTPGFVLYVALRPWLWKSVVVLARNSRKASRALCTNLKDFCHDTAKAAAIRTVASSDAEIAWRSEGGK